MKEKKTGEFVASVVMSVIWLVFANTVPVWRHLTQGVILASWTDILWAVNAAGGVTILGNLLLAYYRPARLRFFFETIFAAVSLMSAVVFYVVFPFDFSRLVGEWLNTLLRALIIVGIGGSAIAIIVYFVRFVAGDRPAASQAQ
jgi:hypothetical protein